MKKDFCGSRESRAKSDKQSGLRTTSLENEKENMGLRSQKEMSLLDL